MVHMSMSSSRPRSRLGPDEQDSPRKRTISTVPQATSTRRKWRRKHWRSRKTSRARRSNCAPRCTSSSATRPSSSMHRKPPSRNAIWRSHSRCCAKPGRLRETLDVPDSLWLAEAETALAEALQASGRKVNARALFLRAEAIHAATVGPAAKNSRAVRH